MAGQSPVDRDHTGSVMESGMRFALWMAQLQRHPSWQQVSVHWNVSRATAYRYIGAWRAATAQPTSDPQ